MLSHSSKNKSSSVTASNFFLPKENLEQQNIIQTKLEVGSPHDPLGYEADDMADKVMRMPMPETINFSSGKKSVQRKCDHCEEEEMQLQKKESSNDSISDAPSIVHDLINSSGGKSLDADTRAYMEPRFNYDFSNVKIHDNDLAAKSAGSIDALAYTSDNNIVFNSGQYNKNSDSGKRLLAHELTHVVQQNQQIPFSTSEQSINRMAVTPYGTAPASKCGSYSYQWKFELDNAASCEGFMVQHVKIYECKEDCSKDPVDYCKAQPKDQFWECWHVTTIGDKVSVDTKRDGWTDNFSEDEKPGSSGTHADVGSIKFFCKDKTGDLNTLWTPNGYSGILPASSSKPSWWDDPSIDNGYHMANAWWNCCGDAATHKHDSDSYPK